MLGLSKNRNTYDQLHIHEVTLKASLTSKHHCACVTQQDNSIMNMGTTNQVKTDL